MTTPTAPASTSPAPNDSPALSALLQLEYGVLYGLSAAAGQLASHVPAPVPPSTTPPAPYGPVLVATTATYDQHRLRRDRLVDALRARSAPVPPADPAYQVTRSEQPPVLLGYLAALAQATVVGYREHLDGLTDPGLRADAVAAVVEAARFRTTVLLAAGRDAADATSAIPG